MTRLWYLNALSCVSYVVMLIGTFEGEPTHHPCFWPVFFNETLACCVESSYDVDKFA